MKLRTPNCPHCGSKARGTVDKVIAEFNDVPDELGKVEYSGTTDLNAQTTITNLSRHSCVVGTCGHEWFTKITE